MLSVITEDSSVREMTFEVIVLSVITENSSMTGMNVEDIVHLKKGWAKFSFYVPVSKILNYAADR